MSSVALRFVNEVIFWSRHEPAYSPSVPCSKWSHQALLSLQPSICTRREAVAQQSIPETRGGSASHFRGRRRWPQIDNGIRAEEIEPYRFPPEDFGSFLAISCDGTGPSYAGQLSLPSLN